MSKKGIILFFTIVGIFLSSCDSVQNEKGNEVEQLLERGEWRLHSYDDPVKHFQTGIKFSEDKQVFYIDSQGHIVPPHHEQKYKVKGDTLVIVDYKFLEDVRYEKGTDILLMKKISDSELILETIHPKKGNILVYKKS